MTGLNTLHISFSCRNLCIYDLLVSDPVQPIILVGLLISLTDRNVYNEEWQLIRELTSLFCLLNCLSVKIERWIIHVIYMFLIILTNSSSCNVNHWYISWIWICICSVLNNVFKYSYIRYMKGIIGHVNVFWWTVQFTIVFDMSRNIT